MEKQQRYYYLFGVVVFWGGLGYCIGEFLLPLLFIVNIL